MKNGLRELRKARGLSQADLASVVEVTRQTINAVEADKYDPSLPLAYRLAAYFDMPVEQLFLNPFREPSAPAADVAFDRGDDHDRR
jgi:putative transcriptional regulator